MRLSQPKLSFLKESETFHFSNRELPVYEKCSSNTRQYYCISHKLMMIFMIYAGHIGHASTHVIVSYCGTHERFEEVK